MNATVHFNAPWSTSLKVISIAAPAIVAALLVLGIVQPGLPTVPRALLVALMTALLIGPVPFVVRGYWLDSNALLIERLGWRTRIPLAGLRSVAHDPGALRGSIRLCGNGGLFSFTGWFWCKALGRYRMFATDPKRAVIMVFEKRRVVVSPARPEDFANEVRLRCGLSQPK
jgi:hypothetical protein